MEFVMLSGPELAAAFSEAMRLKKEKGVTQQQIAKAFGVRQASVSGWGKTGRIAKKHLNLLVEYFSDVVDANHWGLHEAIQDALVRQKSPETPPVLSPAEQDLVAAFRQLPDPEQVDLVRDVMARAESFNQVVKRELERRGISVTGYVSATRAAEKLPAPPLLNSSAPAVWVANETRGSYKTSAPISGGIMGPWSLIPSLVRVTPMKPPKAKSKGGRGQS